MDCAQISSQQNNFVLSNKKQSEWSAVLNQYFGYPYDLNYASNVVTILTNLQIVSIRFAYHSDPEFMSSEFVVYNDNNDQTIMPTVINGLFPTIVIFDSGLPVNKLINTVELINSSAMFVCNLIYTFDGVSFKTIRNSISKTFKVYFKIQPILESNAYQNLYISFAQGTSYGYGPIEEFAYSPARVDGEQFAEHSYVLKLCSKASFVEYGINAPSASAILADSVLSVRVYCDIFGSTVKLRETPQFGYGNGSKNSVDEPMRLYESVFLNLVVVIDDSLAQTRYPLFLYTLVYSDDVWTPNSKVRSLTDGCFVGTGNVYIPSDTRKIKIGFEYIDRRSPGKTDVFEYNNFGEYFTYNVQ
jgi:hypothetical protein